MKEIWRDIKDYEGLYQVSNLGRIRSFDQYLNDKGGIRFKKGRILKPLKGTKCYLLVRLYKNGIGKTFKIHRLVAMSFPDLVDWTEEAKGKPFDELQVNHKDEFDKANNCVDNLEWCTNDYNAHYGTHYERSSKSLLNNKKKSKPVEQYTLDIVFIKEYPSIAEASRQTGIATTDICKCCKGIYKQIGGYVWKYK